MTEHQHQCAFFTHCPYASPELELNESSTSVPTKYLYVLSKAALKKGLIPVPIDKVYPTVGSYCCMSSQNNIPKSRTVCLLFQNRACHEGPKCHQIHLHRDLWQEICSMDFFSPLRHPSAEGDILVHYREKDKSKARQILVPAQDVFITKGSESYFSSQRDIGDNPYKEVCTYFHKKACNYRYNCNQIHIDSATWKTLVELQRLISPVVAVPERRLLPAKQSSETECMPTPSTVERLGAALVENTSSQMRDTSEDLQSTDTLSPPFPLSPLTLPVLDGKIFKRRATAPTVATSETPSKDIFGSFRRHTVGPASLLSPVRYTPAPNFGVTPLRSPTEFSRSRATKCFNTLDDLSHHGPIGPSMLQNPSLSGDGSPAEYSFGSETRSLFSDRKSSIASSQSSTSQLSTSGSDELKEVVWASYKGREAKIRRTKDMEDVADLRDTVFTHFVFPPLTVAADLQLWLNGTRLDIRQPISSAYLKNATIYITLTEDVQPSSVRV